MNPRDEFCGVFIWEISARLNRINSRNNQNGGTETCVVRDCRNVADSCTFTNKANWHTPKDEIRTRPKLCHFGRYVVRAKLFCLKSFVPVTGLECSYGKIFIPVTEISVAKTEISVTGPARPLIWTHRYFYKEKSGEARSRKPSQPGRPGSYEEALLVTWVRCVTKQTHVTWARSNWPSVGHHMTSHVPDVCVLASAKQTALTGGFVNSFAESIDVCGMKLRFFIVKLELS